MNAANLQIEGLLVAVECIQRLLVEKGLMGAGEIDQALHTAEASFIADERLEGLTPANRDAVLFPLRFLRKALASEQAPTFAELAKQVGETKPHYNDQL